MAIKGDQPITVMVLQGGGALGAYQAGVYAALVEAGVALDGIAGISIGAINSAIIAGNAPAERVAKLHAFWDKVSSGLTAPAPTGDGRMQRWFAEVSASIAATTGIPGMFAPRLPPAWLTVPGMAEAISIYDTAPLRQTLLELVDFDRINARETQLAVGAVNVLTGNFTYFDSRHRRIVPEHIMASAALPPGFPPVMIDGEPYWDGGIVSNTPLQYLIDNHPTRDCTVYQVDLFSARGPMPLTLADATQREKDIRFSSRTRLNTDMLREIKRLRDAGRRLAAKLPAELRDDEDARLLAEKTDSGAITILHLINRAEGYETPARDYEFSRATVMRHWDTGLADTRHALAHPDWTGRRHYRSGVHIFDLAKERQDKA